MKFRTPRPRAVWAAFITALAVCLLIAFGVLLPILGLIAAADGGTAGALNVPVGQIVLALVIGYGLSLVLLALCVRVRRGAPAWVLGVAAVVSALLVSVWPLVVTALAGAGQVQGVLPAIQQLLEQVTGG
jgi:ABC-type transport system involved in multi-copper enzyme maturation permease subunit